MATPTPSTNRSDVGLDPLVHGACNRAKEECTPCRGRAPAFYPPKVAPRPRKRARSVPAKGPSPPVPVRMLC
eukprot:7263739-Karenia_brevis.AAC.1